MTVARRILLHVALGVFLLVAVVTAVTYALVYDALKQSGLKQLRTYVTERADREEARFQQVQANLTLVRGMFLKRLEIPMSPEHIEERFNYWNRRYDDGAWRTREQFGDAHKNASLWADRDWPATLEMRRMAAIVQELCDEMLPGWFETFPSYYFQFPKPGLLNAGVDVLLADWTWKMPAHFDTTGLEWISLALPEGLPPDRFSWTGLQADDVVSEPLVSVYLPVIKDGAFIASVGHNMSMRFMIDAAAHSEIGGASHYIFRADGRLIAHPTRRADILASKGLLKAQDCGDAVLASLYRIANTRSDRRFDGFDASTDTYYSVARLAGPEWFYVTAMSRDYLQKEASQSAHWVLWSGLVSLGLVLGFIATILRSQVARPLAELNRATKAMSEGASDTTVPTAHADELGELAGSFREMVARVAERENDLRQLNTDLEKRVSARTDDLNQALARERELGEMKSNFVSLVSHEFRTPLGVIMSAVEVLQRYFERLSAEKRARHLEMIFRSTKNLAALIEEVLLLSRVEEGRMRFKPLPIDLEKFCRALCDEMRSATGATCPIRFSAAALEGAVSDESILRHILTNLLSNACKYSAAGSDVDFLAERVNGSVVLTVRDRGIGIPADDQTRLFTSFTRGGNVGTRPGTGLGLVVVQRCVQLHGGTLQLVSEVGQGTTVTISLPVFSNALNSTSPSP